jgi:ABC-type microcin C transport system duplicated ATPase subunit YejF
MRYDAICFAYLKKKESLVLSPPMIVRCLVFSDETIVIQNGKLLPKAIQKTIYENPSNKYVALLRGQ